jgi:hypothetical protein
MLPSEATISTDLQAWEQCDLLGAIAGCEVEAVPGLVTICCPGLHTGTVFWLLICSPLSLGSWSASSPIKEIKSKGLMPFLIDCNTPRFWSEV